MSDLLTFLCIYTLDKKTIKDDIAPLDKQAWTFKTHVIS
jgi:hypothetical protein